MGPVTEMVADVVARCGYDPGDPRTTMAIVALRLAADWDTRPREGVRETLDRLLLQITASAGEPPTPLDESQAAVAVKLGELLLGYHPEPTVKRDEPAPFLLQDE